MRPALRLCRPYDCNDCNDSDAEVGTTQTWYRDADTDDWGNSDNISSETGCESPGGYVPTPGDCDDFDDRINPDADDDCGDGVDSDCDGVGGPDDDEDGDGLSWTEEQALGTDDCNEDTDGDGHTDGEEVEAGSDPMDPESTPPPDDSRPTEGCKGCAQGGGAPASTWLPLLAFLARIRCRTARPRPAS